MPKTNRRITGDVGEEIACGYLVGNGYKIIERNFWRPWGEIDIIAKNPHKILTFVEVKTIKALSCQGLTPEDQLSTAKLLKLKRIAVFYANNNPQMLSNRGWQIDLIAITIDPDHCSPSLTIKDNCFVIHHYQNIT